MSDYELKNAKIDGTKLGVAYTELGILSFNIGLNFGSTHQGFGGWCLDTVNPEYEKHPSLPVRVATPLASELMLGIDKVLGVNWEDLKGTPCRAYTSWSLCFSIGHYLEDKWLWMENLHFVTGKFTDMVKCCQNEGKKKVGA